MGTTSSNGSRRPAAVVRPIDTPRAAASARAMEETGAELGQLLTAAVGESMWAQLFGPSVLEADDIHGHNQRLVVQHDHVRWADLLAVATFAASQLNPADHPGPGCRTLTGGCPACRAKHALARLRTCWNLSGLDLTDVQATETIGAAGLGSSTAASAGSNWPTPGAPGAGAPSPDGPAPHDPAPSGRRA